MSIVKTNQPKLMSISVEFSMLKNLTTKKFRKKNSLSVDKSTLTNLFGYAHILFG